MTEVLVRKARRALRHTGLRLLAVSGGVSCNSALRRELAAMCANEGAELLLPPAELTTDNAAMIGYAGLLHARIGERSALTTPVDPNPTLAGYTVRP